MVILVVMTTFMHAADDDRVNVNFRNLSVKDFIEMVSKITHKNILIDADLKGKINFVSQEPIKKSSLIPLANSILGSKGLTIIDQGDYYKVVKASSAAGEGLDVSSSIDGDTMKTVMFPLKNANAAVIRAKIKPLLGKSDKVISFKDNNVLAVTATPRTLRSISKLIHAIEKKGMKRSVVIQLKNSSVKDLYPNAQNMAKKLFPQTIESEKVDIFKDDATNSIILVGKEDNIHRMIRYIKQLDIKGEDQTQKMYVIRLKNSNVEEMEKILSKLVAQMNNVAVKKAKKGTKPSKAMVVSDVERNALIVLATGEQIKNIRETVRKIDIPKVQVYVKARIVEIDRSLAEQVGFKYGLNGGAITSSGLFTLAGNLGAQALQMDPGLLAFLNTNQTKTIYDDNGNPIGTETDPAFKFDSVDQVFALGAQLGLLEQNGAAHILSEPSILCTNNKEAEIYVGRTMSILTQAQQSTQGTSNVVNNYSREDIGLTLKVKPRLSSNNKVTLEVVTTIEDVLENESPSADRPTTTKRDVKTTAIVNNGEMIILGGLIKSSGGAGSSKVPFLGDIPVLGEMFFTHTSDVTRETNVVIYLTPYIVRRSDELQKLKKHLEKLEEVQKEYNRLIGKVLEERAEGGLPVVDTPTAASNRIKHQVIDVPKSNLDILDATEEF
jgi:general secretion pathway protein D